MGHGNLRTYRIFQLCLHGIACRVIYVTMTLPVGLQVTVSRPPESPLGGWSLFRMEIFKKWLLGRVPSGQELDLASEIAGSQGYM